ncbi:hypothetical protein GYH30_047668 [Glycine max]|nr:hypothetical protein GYH30_047668 [Glycine max]
MESKLKDASGLVHAKEIVKRNGIDAIIYIANGGSILKEHLCFRKRFKAYDIWGDEVEDLISEAIRDGEGAVEEGAEREEVQCGAVLRGFKAFRSCWWCCKRTCEEEGVE